MRKLKADKSDLFGTFVVQLLFSIAPLLLATLPLMVQGQQADRKPLERQLTQKMAGTAINLPTPINATRLRFDHDGNIIGNVDPSSTLYLYFEIKTIKVKKNRYEIRGFPMCIDPAHTGPAPKFYRVLRQKKIYLATTPASISREDFRNLLTLASQWSDHAELTPRPEKVADQAADNVSKIPLNADGTPFKGKVELQTIVDEEGHVGSIEILKSAGCHIDLAAIRKVETFAYKPTRHKGKAVAVPTQITIVFKP